MFYFAKQLTFSFFMQVVPDFNHGQDYEDDYRPRSKVLRGPATFPEVSGADIEMMLAELSNPPSTEESKDKVRIRNQHYKPIAKGSCRALLSDNSCFRRRHCHRPSRRFVVSS